MTNAQITGSPNLEAEIRCAETAACESGESYAAPRGAATEASVFGLNVRNAVFGGDGRE